jgi:DNA-binding transcriptional LysR family regulator
LIILSDNNHFQMKIENTSDLWVLVHTARTGSLTGAAAATGLTPAAASATLKRLETQLNTRLFERSTRAMRLTPQGQTLLEYATRAFELVAEGVAQVTADRANIVGTIRVTAPSDLARTVLLPWIDEFIAGNPGVHIALSVGDRMLDVVRDEVDVAIRYGELADSRLVARRLLDAQPIVTAAPGYLARHPAPKTPADLVGHNCLIFGRGGHSFRVWKFVRDGVWSEVRITSDRSVDDASLARQWAIAGAGILFKTALEQKRDLESGALVQLLPEWQAEPYPLNAVLPSGRFVPNRVRMFVDFLARKLESSGTVPQSLQQLAPTGI